MPENITANNDNGNGRMTLALLGQKVDRLSDDVREFIRKTEERRDIVDKLLRELERTQAVEKERLNISKEEEKCLRIDIDSANKKIDDIQTKTNWWNGANSALALVASTIAAVIGKQS